jgi:hypothetical protein
MTPTITPVKGTCDWHRSVAVECEQVSEGPKAIMVKLRCPECGRARGIRRIRKQTSTN